MNKLVSKNPVQRFKQKKKIQKAQKGWKVFNTKPFDNYNKLKEYKTSALPKGFQQTLDQGADLLNQIQEEEIKKARASYDNQIKNSRPKIIKKNWEDEFTNNFTNTLTNSQRQYLDSKGVNYTNAAEVQKFLMDQLQTDLGGYKNDGKWGKNSIQAWKDFVANSIPENFDVQRNQETMTIGNKPYVEQSTTPAPTLGYRTYNTYEGNDFSNRLKSMGIKSNADLIDFMHKTNGENYNWNGDSWARQFRSDVNQALGGDYSDANIRKTFNTSGNWGKGFLGRGDIGDFQNALQINAGTWNGIYDNKLQNLVKNIDWSKFKYFKQGGNLLPSRNIVERFKQRNFRLVAQ